MTSPPPGPSTEEATSLGRRSVTTERDFFHPVTMALAVGVGALSCAASTVLHPGFLWVMLLAPIVLAAWRTMERSRVAQLTRSGDELVIAGEGEVTRVALGSIRSAHVARHSVGAVRAAVVCTRADGSTLALGADDPEDAAALVAALGFDASRRRTVFRGTRLFHGLLAAPLAPFFSLLLVLFATSAAALSPPAVLLVAVWAGLTALLWRLMVPALDTAVGLDGITVRGRFGTHFYPWSEVAEVDVGDGDFDLRLRDGRVRSVWCNPEDDTVLPALVRTARAALGAFRHAAEDADAAALLDRQGRPVAEWRAAMGELLRRPADYRHASIDRERVQAVLADPATPVERRLGAALALAHEPDEARSRVRIAAEVVADPGARAALTRIADGVDSDDAVEQALRGSDEQARG